MYLYWRVQQDLTTLGEVIAFHDPRFIRCLCQWVRRNASGIRRAETLGTGQILLSGLN